MPRLIGMASITRETMGGILDDAVREIFEKIDDDQSGELDRDEVVDGKLLIFNAKFIIFSNKFHDFQCKNSCVSQVAELMRMLGRTMKDHEVLQVTNPGKIRLCIIENENQGQIVAFVHSGRAYSLRGICIHIIISTFST